MTPEQEALRDRIAEELHDWPDLGSTTMVDAEAMAAQIFEGIPGLRMVGDDEVVVKRSRIREGWLDVYGPKPDAWCVRSFERRPGPLGSDEDRPCGVISPWPPEESS